MPIQGPQRSEREAYVQFIYLPIYLALARGNKEEMDRQGKVNKKELL